MLTDNERIRYHNAVQLLKRGVRSYEYNRIAYLHVDLRAMPSAHTGPTFPLWHPRRSPDGSSSESYNRTNVGHGASSGEGRYGYGGGGYGGKTSPTTTTPSTYTTTPAEEYTTPSPTPAPPKERVCYDNHECCAQWAAKNACKTAPRYMNTWCPGSCNYDGCQPQPQQQRSAGKDRYMQCKRWSKFHEHYGRAEGWRTYRPNKVLKREKLRNECERNPHWMACNCPEACSSVKRKTDECTKHFPKDYLLEPLDDN
uniref:ShKT domain-containing protein n=1 Tax=Globodera pallida TaxID=36090 RepID=A0A183BW72_GLOPA